MIENQMKENSNSDIQNTWDKYLDASNNMPQANVQAKQSFENGNFWIRHAKDNKDNSITINKEILTKRDENGKQISNADLGFFVRLIGLSDGSRYNQKIASELSDTHPQTISKVHDKLSKLGYLDIYECRSDGLKGSVCKYILDETSNKDLWDTDKFSPEIDKIVERERNNYKHQVRKSYNSKEDKM